MDVKGDLEDVHEVLHKIAVVEAEAALLEKQQEILQSFDLLDDLCTSHNAGLVGPLFVKIKAELVVLAGSIPSATYLSQRLHGYLESIMNALEGQLVAGLKAKNQHDVLILASSYSLLGKFRDFERIFVSEVSVAFCAASITQSRLEELCRDDDEQPGLVRLYHTVCQFMEAAKDLWITPLNELMDRKLAANLLVQPVLARITAELGVIYSPGIPDAFQHSFVATHEFLQRLLQLFPEESSHIVDLAGWNALMKGWQINIYYQLRFRDLAAQIEDALDIPLPVISLASAEFNLAADRMPQLKTLQQSVELLWSDSVMIHSLMTKFFKLTLQTCARFIDWLVSNPKEFEGTELGLSTLYVKFYQLYELRSFLEKLMQTAVEPTIKANGGDISVVQAVAKRFLATKWADGQAHLQTALQRSIQIYAERAFADPLGSKRSTAQSLGNICSNLKFLHDPKALVEPVVREVTASFVLVSTGLADASTKVATNIKRLESVMKATVTEEDRVKLASHQKLLERLRSEAASLVILAQSHNCDTSGLEKLIRGL